jgi:hypothetical protein
MFITRPLGEGGSAYKVGDVFSERYFTHDEARGTAQSDPLPNRGCRARLKISSTWTKRVTGTRKSLRGRVDRGQTSRDKSGASSNGAGLLAPAQNGLSLLDLTKPRCAVFAMAFVLGLPSTRRQKGRCICDGSL